MPGSVIELHTIEQAFDVLDSLTQDFSYLEDKELSLADDWVTSFSIKIDGENFSSTLDTDIMSAFIKLQKSYYDIYSIIEYGYVKRLSKEEKDHLKIWVEVSGGSTDLKVLIKEYFKLAMEKFSGRQAVLLGAILAASVSGVYLGNQAIKESYKFKTQQLEIEKRQQEIRVKEIEAEEERIRSEERLKTIEKLIEINKIGTEAPDTVLRQIGHVNFETLEVNGESLDHNEIREQVKIEKPEPIVPIVRMVSGTYSIDDINNKRNFIAITNIETGQVIKPVLIPEEIRTDGEQIEALQDSLMGENVMLHIVLEKQGDTITRAYLANKLEIEEHSDVADESDEEEGPNSV